MKQNHKHFIIAVSQLPVCSLSNCSLFRSLFLVRGKQSGLFFRNIYKAIWACSLILFYDQGSAKWKYLQIFCVPRPHYYPPGREFSVWNCRALETFTGPQFLFIVITIMSQERRLWSISEGRFDVLAGKFDWVHFSLTWRQWRQSSRERPTYIEIELIFALK